MVATSLRGALRAGFSNGQAKSVVYDLVTLVRQNCLCDKHNLALNMYVHTSFCLVLCYCLTNDAGQAHILQKIGQGSQ